MRPLRFFLDGRPLVSALGADQSQEIPGVKGVAANGLLSSGAESDIDAAIVGEDQERQIAHHFLTFLGTQVRIVCHLLLDLVGRQLVLFAKRLQFKVVSGDAVLHKEGLGAFDAALGKLLVIFGRAARVRVAAED